MGPARLTVAVRSVPGLSVPCGTRVARTGRSRQRRRAPRAMVPAKGGHHHMGAQAKLARRGCTFGLTCQDAGAGRIRPIRLRGNDLGSSARARGVHPASAVQHPPGCAPVPLPTTVSAGLR
jgi:hypothetical protein